MSVTLQALYAYINSLGPIFHLNYVNVHTVASTSNLLKIVFNNEPGLQTVCYLFICLIIAIKFRIVGDLPFLQKASFRAEVVTPKMRLKREIIFSFEGMIVSFGGAATLFLGISLWQISKSLLFLINKFLSMFE